MSVSLIAAIGKNNELGKGNDLLWRLPSDQKYFHEITSGHIVIMGRKTFESIGRVLPNRKNIVITHNINYKADKNAVIVHSLNEALDSAKNSMSKSQEIFIVGGAQIYKQALPLADKLYVTHIDAEDEAADTFFPTVNSDWKEIYREAHEADQENIFGYTFVNYQK
jgi:dihydrofolate reductase